MIKLSSEEYDAWLEEFSIYAAESGMDRELEYLTSDVRERANSWIEYQLGAEFEVQDA